MIFNFLLLLCFVAMFLWVAIAKNPYGKARNDNPLKEANVYVLRKQLPEGVVIVSAWKRFLSSLTGRINLRTTRLHTDAVAFEPPVYSDGSLIQPYQGVQLTFQYDPIERTSMTLLYNLYAVGALKLPKSGQKGFDYDFTVELEPTLRAYLISLYGDNGRKRVTRNVNHDTRAWLYYRGLENNSRLRDITKRNFTPVVFALLGAITLFCGVVWRITPVAMVAAVVAAVLIVGWFDRKSEIWSWIYYNRIKYVVDEDTAGTLLNVLAYRNYLARVAEQESSVLTYSSHKTQTARMSLAWATAFDLDRTKWDFKSAAEPV